MQSDRVIQDPDLPSPAIQGSVIRDLTAILIYAYITFASAMRRSSSQSWVSLVVSTGGHIWCLFERIMKRGHIWVREGITKAQDGE